MKSFVLLPLLLIGCHPRAIVVDPIHPRAVRVQETAIATAKSAAKVQKSVAKVSEQSSLLSKEIIAGMLAASAQRKAGLATPEQLDANLEMWENVHTRNRFLEAANQTAMIDTRGLQEFAKRGEEEATALVPEAKQTDDNTAKIIVEKEKLQGDADFGKKVKWGIGIAVFLLLVYLVLAFIWPFAKKLINPIA